ncbi:MAG: hypothetical protein MHM6MM_007634 [Cercozoa sp. M6MM]
MSAVDTDLQSCLELSVQASDLPDKDALSKSDGFVVVELKEGSGAFVEVSRTETVFDAHHPRFARSFDIVFKFETAQKLKFSLYDNDCKGSDDLTKHTLLGTCECSVARLVNARNMTLTEPVEASNGKTPRNKKSKKQTTLTLRAEERAANNDTVYFDMSASKLPKMDILSHADPYVEIARALEDGSWQPVHKTEIIKRKKSPVWKPFTISLQKLCNADIHRPLLLRVWDWDSDGRHDLIGELQLPLADLIDRSQVETAHTTRHELERFANRGTRKANKRYGTLQVRARIEVCTHSNNFLDYIRGGVKIALCAAVDFTASNGDPTNPTSLHHFSAQGHNQYSEALATIGQILSPYDSDGSIAAWGFGARLMSGRKRGQVSHCFPLNDNDMQPEVAGVPGLLDAYRETFKRIRLSGPTNFSSVLDSVIKIASTPYTDCMRHYTVLLILTDGLICDMEQTVERLVTGSNLPLSIVIVGVGDADFSGMEALDGDDGVLTDRKGRRAARDIVQFVPYNSVNSDSWELARVTLQEVLSLSFGT